MNTYSPSQINDAMAKVAPELQSSYASYPLERDHWYHPSDKGDYGEPCFLQLDDEGMKKNYAYGPGIMGRGYYSLLCKDAYRAIHARLQKDGSGVPFFSFGSKEKADYQMVKRIVYLRGWGSTPDDVKCREDGVQSGMFMGPSGM